MCNTEEFEQGYMYVWTLEYWRTQEYEPFCLKLTFYLSIVVVYSSLQIIQSDFS